MSHLLLNILLKHFGTLYHKIRKSQERMRKNRPGRIILQMTSLLGRRGSKRTSLCFDFNDRPVRLIDNDDRLILENFRHLTSPSRSVDPVFSLHQNEKTAGFRRTVIKLFCKWNSFNFREISENRPFFPTDYRALSFLASRIRRSSSARVLMR